MADRVSGWEGNIIRNMNGQLLMASPGSESMARIKRVSVNVGDPTRSSRKEVSTHKPNQQGGREGG